MVTYTAYYKMSPMKGHMVFNNVHDELVYIFQRSPEKENKPGTLHETFSVWGKKICTY